MKVIDRKISLLITFSILLITLSIIPLNSKAALEIEGESAILVDAATGKILYSKNPDIALPPASMTKMMTEYLVWEAVEEGKIKWDDETEISDYPYSISANDDFSGVGLYQDEKYTVKQLYEAMAINSDNATTIALAELIAGSEGEFVKLMNEKGEEMGLPDFKFVNSTGLENKSLGDNYPKGTDPDGTNLLSARSSALLAYYLVNDYPESLEISSIPEIEFDDQTVRNWNYMLDHEASFLKQYHYEGVDGLKTGYTDLAGYCFTGTSIRDGKRLITVVMKTESEEARFEQTAQLMDYGYKNFENEELFPEGYQLKGESSLPVAKGKEKNVEFATKESVNAIIKEGEEENYQIQYQIDEKLLNGDGELIAPISKGQKVGVAELVSKDEQDAGYIFSADETETVDLVTTEAVKKNNWLMITLGAIGSFFSGLFSTIVDMIKGWF